MSWVSKRMREWGWYPKRNPIDKFKKHVRNKVMPSLEKLWIKYGDDIIDVLARFLEEVADGKFAGWSAKEMARDLFERIKNKLRELVASPDDH